MLHGTSTLYNLKLRIRTSTDFLLDSSLEMLPNGALIVDHTGRTNLEDVFAAGDCAGIPTLFVGSAVFVPLATGANKLGRVIGDVLAGKNNRYPGTLSSACIKVFGVEAGRTGLSERDALSKGIEFKSVLIKDKDHASYWPGPTDIAVKLIYSPTDKKLLGGQAVRWSGSCTSC